MLTSRRLLIIGNGVEVGVFGGRLERSSLTGVELLMMDLLGFEDNDSFNFAKVKFGGEKIARAFDEEWSRAGNGSAR